jgi:hypothetical protein
MQGLDKEFREHYRKAWLEIDWTGFSVWVVGGLCSTHATLDIDVYIYGQDRAKAVDIMWKLKQLGPWDPQYIENMDLIKWNWDCQPLRASAAHTINGETLRWFVTVIPSLKMKMKQRAGYETGRPIQLIQNGTEIYL